MGSGIGGGGGNMAALQGAQQQQEAAQTQQQIATMQTQTRADAMKGEAQRHQIMMETRNKVMEMARETAINRTKSATKLHNKHVQVIMA